MAEVWEAVHRKSAVATDGKQLRGEAMRLAHTVADEQDDIASDGRILNFDEPQTGHDCLSRGM